MRLQASLEEPYESEFNPLQTKHRVDWPWEQIQFTNMAAFPAHFGLEPIIRIVPSEPEMYASVVWRFEDQTREQQARALAAESCKAIRPANPSAPVTEALMSFFDRIGGTQENAQNLGVRGKLQPARRDKLVPHPVEAVELQWGGDGDKKKKGSQKVDGAHVGEDATHKGKHSAQEKLQKTTRRVAFDKTERFSVSQICAMLNQTETALTRISLKVKATIENPRCKLQCQKGGFNRFVGGGVYGYNEPGVRCAFNHFTNKKKEFRQWANSRLELEPVMGCNDTAACDVEERALSFLRDRSRQILRQ